MDENKTNVTKKETLAALRNPVELYVLMSATTRMPFVHCDEETFDDEVFLYYRLEDAKEKARELDEQKYQTAPLRLDQEEKVLLSFYTNLYVMGVNCLAVNCGTEKEIKLALEELVTRRKPEEMPENQQIVENPALHLTALYFMQEMRHLPGPEPTEELKEIQEEMLAHFQSSTLLVAVQEDGQVPLLKQQDGSVYQPVFTDLIEFQKFSHPQKLRAAMVPSVKILEMMPTEAKGVVINPFGVNVQLQIARTQQPQS